MINDPSFLFIVPIFLFLVGAAMGSFAGATVWRIKKGKDIVNDRSECEHCHHKLAARDLFPIFSWLFLRGKCRYCHKPIGIEPLLYELGVGLYFALSYIFWPFGFEFWYQIADFVLWLVYGIGLAILFGYDLKWYLLPDKVVYPLIALGAVDTILRIYATPGGVTLGVAVADIFLSLAVVGGFYYVLHAVSGGRWVGFGDVKLGVFIGLALGWQLAVVCLFAANLIGTILVLPGLLSGKLNRRARIPFGPLLIAGFVIAGLWGQPLIDWYMLLLTPAY